MGKKIFKKRDKQVFNCKYQLKGNKQDKTKISKLENSQKIVIIKKGYATN